MAELTNISLARGAPSLDIIAVDDLRAAAQAAFERDPAGTFAYGTSAGYPRLLEWIAAKHDVSPDCIDRHERLDAGRRVPVPEARRARRPRGRRGAHLRPHAARAAPAGRADPRHPARGGRHRRRRARGGAPRGRAPDARAHHPELPEPGRLHAVAREAPASCSRWPRSSASPSSRTTRTSSSASRASPCPRCSPWTRRTRSSTRPRSRRRSARGSASATWSGPSDVIGEHPQARHEHLHLAEHGRPVDRRRVLPLRRASSARSRPSRRRSASAATRPPTPWSGTSRTPAS